MENVVLIVHLILALSLIGVVLLVMFALFAPVDKLLGTLDAFRCPRPLSSASS